MVKATKRTLGTKLDPPIKDEVEKYAKSRNRTASQQVAYWIEVIMASPPLRQTLEANASGTEPVARRGNARTAGK